MSCASAGAYKLFACYHGTDASCAPIILKSGFRKSIGIDHWYGDGVYFFIDGIMGGEAAAISWAKLQAWDSSKRVNSYDRYTVLITLFESQSILDLRDAEGLTVFNQMRQKLLSRYLSIPSVRKQISGSNKLDHYVCTELGKLMELDAILGNCYIKLDRDSRIKQINSRVPNVTVICVCDESKVDIEVVEVLHEGDVE